MKIRFKNKPSKNCDGTPLKPEFIIIHCIGYELEKVLKILTEKTEFGAVSTHYVIPHTSKEKENTFTIYRLVDNNVQARHAGVSKWHHLENFNSRAIGIEFHLPNYAYALEPGRGLNWYHFEKFLADQLEAGRLLIKQLTEKYQIPPENILFHSDIAPWRLNNNNQVILGKTDPGAYFTTEKYAKLA